MKNIFRYWKPVIGVTVGLGMVITPITWSLINASNQFTLNDKRYVLALPASIKSLNPFAIELASANQMESSYNAALLKSIPSGDNQGGIATILSLPKLEMANHDADLSPQKWVEIWKNNIDKNDSDRNPKFNEFFQKGGKLNPSGSNSSYSYKTSTYDLASSVWPIRVSDSGTKKVLGIKFELRDTYFWNGDRLSAEDFIETIKQALNVKNACPWAYYITDILKFTNAKKIYDAQTKEHLSFKDALKKYPLGIFAVDEIPENKWSNLKNKADKKNAIDWYKKRKLKKHSSIIYTGEADISTLLVKIGYGAICAPTNVRFINNVGFKKYGRNIKSIMGIGPFKPVYANLDYRIIANRWDGYWDRKRVLSPQVEMRIVTDTTTQVQLFINKKLAKVSFGSQLLKIFNTRPDLKKFVKPSKYAAGTSYFRFNLNPNRKYFKYLKNVDLRRAIMYSMDRESYQLSSGADSSYPGEIFTSDALMGSPLGETVRSIIEGTSQYKGADPKNLTFFEKNLNKIKTYNRDLKIVYRTNYQTTSSTPYKNKEIDNLQQKDIAKLAYAKFRKENGNAPKEIKLSLLINSSISDSILSLKQSIEENLPGIKIVLLPKPTQTIFQTTYKMKEFDLAFSRWSPDYNDPWTYYHLISDKIGFLPNKKDPATKGGFNQNSNGPYSSLIDYIAEKLSENKNYFKENLYIDNKTLAQYLRMSLTIRSSDPTANTQGYDSKILDKSWLDPNPEKSKKNKTVYVRGYKGILKPEYTKLIKEFIVANSQEHEDKWRESLWRFHNMYVVAEKLIRDSAYGMVISHLSNQYVASRSIGFANYGFIDSLSFAYNADNIPNTPFDLPGLEAITH